MTARLKGWPWAGGEGPVEAEERPMAPEPVAAKAPGQVSARMIDEAVENVMRSQRWPDDTAEVLRFNLARDVDGDVTHAYYASRVAQHRSAVANVTRKELTIRYVLTEEEVTALTEYAPNFNLRFESRDSHDHAMAAACRLVDHKVIRSRLPYGVPFTDVGGNPLVYMKAGEPGVHVCGALLDAKDPMRYVLRRMEAEVLATTAASAATRALAAEYLRPDHTGAFVCGKTAQECEVKSALLVSVHVYDIAMQDWPEIMEKKGAQVVEGCLLFSPNFWEKTEGRLGVSGARYEIDVKANTFSMGFKGSPSWWYQHEWSSYMLYGTDQMLYSANSTYAYKVVERRGDTLFFRIVRVDVPPTVTGFSSSYKMPGLPVVKVNGFALRPSVTWFSPTMLRKDYTFPAALWRDMVTQASEDFERGAMDYLKMYNHYRTISVRQTVNAVLVMGGEQVDHDDLVPLVVHACMAAAAMSLLGQRVTRELTTAQMAGRQRASEATYKKICRALWSIGSTVATAPLAVFRPLADMLNRFSMSLFDEWLLEWEPVWEVVVIDPRPLFHKAHLPMRSVDLSFATAAARELAPLHPLALAQQDPALHALFQRLHPGVVVEGGAERPSDDTAKPESAAPGVGAGGSAASSVPGTAAPSYVSVSADEIERRREAIREHLVEIQQQNQAVSSTCARAYRTLMATGSPNRKLLTDRAESLKNPDFWYVEGGVVSKSALGVAVGDFQHSAVYSVDPDVNGNFVRAVHRKTWVGVENGVGVKRDHHVLSDETFTGWVLVVDGLIVYNGPEIIDSMTRALAMDHQYEIEINQGPPGCGKTYSIIHAMRTDGQDVVLCPVKESAVDTRDRVLAKEPNFPDAQLRVRTVDSYLVGLSYSERTKQLKADEMYADECYMTHAGKWYAAAALLGVRRIRAYGDKKQIHHIPRVQAPCLFVDIVGAEVYTYLTRRCPRSAVAAWGGVYEWKVRSTSEVESPLLEVGSTVGMDIPKGCTMMCMYQADKVALKKLYGARTDVVILTSHEAEGKTYEHVWLHRFDVRKRTDGYSLFDKEAHVLVAMSRHTHSFVYVRQAGLTDQVTSWVSLSKDPRRLAAAAEVGTAGESKEFS